MALILVALAWLAAMAAVGVWGAPWWMGAGWALAALPLVGSWREAGWRTGLACVAAALVAGALFAHWEQRAPAGLGELAGERVTLEGRVVSEPEPGLTVTRYEIEVDRVDGRPADLSVLVSTNQYARYLPGDRLRLEGTLDEPPEESPGYAAYLRSQRISGTMLFPDVERVSPGSGWSIPRQAARIRLALEESLQRALPEPEASLAAGLAFGRDASLPPELEQDFRDSGLAHLTAVSGSNVTIVAGIVFYLVTPLLGRRRSLPLAGIAILLYLVAAGLSWSVLRAGLMAVIYLVGVAIGRPQASLPALALAAMVFTAIDPGAAADVGFQLSFAATAGIIIFAPWIRAAFDRGLARLVLAGTVPAPLTQVAAMTTAATLATLPIQVVVFQRLSLIGIVANIVVEPVVAVAMVLAGLAAVAGTVSSTDGWVLGVLAYYPVAFIAWVARSGASLPFAAVNTPSAGPAAGVVAYVALTAVAWPAYRRLAPATPDPRREPRARAVRRLAVAGACGGVAFALLPLGLLPARGPGDLEVAFLDVGQGDSILVTTPHGKQLLVDGGPSGIGVARELGAVMPHWDRSLDAVVLTHPQEDHVGGLPAVLRRFDAGTVYVTGADNDTESVEYFHERAGEARRLRRGDWFDLDGVRVEVVWPPLGELSEELNDTSLVLRLTYGEVSVLLTGDIEAGPEDALLAEGLAHADVLKVPHHGSKTSDPAFLRAVGSSVAVISVGDDNRFGHPHEETLAALEGTQVYRTDKDGRVVVSSDGRAIGVRTEH